MRSEAMHAQYKRVEGEKKEIFHSKDDYFSHLMMKYFPEMGFLLREARLSDKDKAGNRLPPDSRDRWDNVFDHCLTELAVAENLTDVLGFSFREKDKICQAVAMHDWDKRLEKRPQDFTDEERKAMIAGMQSINVDKTLLNATKEGFMQCVVDNESISFSEKLMHYIDCICDENEVTSIEKRIEIATGRNQILLDDPALNKKIEDHFGVGMNYFDAAKIIANETQKKIYEILKERGHQISSPEDLPTYIKKLIELNYKTE